MSQGKFAFYKEEFPAIDWFDISPNDSSDLDTVPRSLYVGSGGDISVVSDNGNTVVFQSVPGGTILPIQPVRVRATDTTATDIVGIV